MGPMPSGATRKCSSMNFGCVIVRTSQLPQSPHFLDACDELGLLVFEELPGCSMSAAPHGRNKAMTDLRE
jgi:beta-galactosidase